MYFDKEIHKKFYDEFIKLNQDKFEDILNHIKSIGTSLSIHERGIKGLDLSSSSKVDLNIYETENGISIPYLFDGFFDMIKPYISRGISKLEIPYSSSLNEFLKELSNLNTLVINRPITFEDIVYLEKNTNIKNIEVPLMSFFHEFDSVNILCTSESDYYKDITIKPKQVIGISNKRIVLETLDKKLLNDYLSKISSSIEEGRFSIYVQDTGLQVELFNNTLNVSDMNELVYFSELFKKYGCKIDKINTSIILKSQKYNDDNYIDRDYNELDNLNRRTPINITYTEDYSETDDYNEFRTLIEALKWYRQLIRENDLSPLEKLTYAYDIMKTYTYNAGNNQYGPDTRRPSRIVSGGDIVCAGYTALLSEILNGLDDNLKTADFSVLCFDNLKSLNFKGAHSRSIVRIDDDKYNVHGIYVLDPTWDSVKSQGTKTIDSEYDALSLYKYFLIPITEYGQVFPNDSKPDFFVGETKKVLKEDTSEENIDLLISCLDSDAKILDYNLSKCLGVTNLDNKTILNEFKSKRISFDDFIKLIENVRLSEGYSGSVLENEINKIARINKSFFPQEESDIKKK